MGKDNRRIAAPDNCLSPETFKEKGILKSIINEENVRIDGRSESDLKNIALQVGIVPTVTGSAYLESGKTKVICSVNGPRDVLTRSESSTKGQLYCEFKYTMFSCKDRRPYVPTDEEMSISKSIQDALEPVVLLHKFPKSRLDICILVLEDDGGAIPAALTCAGAALSNAGVEVYDLPVGCSLVHCGTQFLVDPTAHEESYCKATEDCAIIALAMMVEYKNQVIFMDSYGCVNRDILSRSSKILQNSCYQILADIRSCLKHHVKQLSTCSGDSSDDNAPSKSHEAQLKLLQPQRYLSTFLENAIRPDGRDLKQFRSVLINVGAIGNALGSALVRLGDTSILCGIKAELTNPSPREPNQGFFVPNVTLTPVCSGRYTPGPPTEQAQVCSQAVASLWRDSRFLDPESLCVVPGRLAWCVFAEMVCLSCDGNVLDACVLALMAALRNSRLPKVGVDDEAAAASIRVSVDETVDLPVRQYVFSATFAVLGDSAVADPTADEEALAQSAVTVFLKGDGETNVQAFGSVREEQLLQCIDCANDRYAEMMALLDNLN